MKFSSLHLSVSQASVIEMSHFLCSHCVSKQFVINERSINIHGKKYVCV